MPGAAPWARRFLHVTLQPGSSGAHQAAGAGRGMSLQLCPSSGQGCTHSSTGSQPPHPTVLQEKSCYSKSSSHQHISNPCQVVTARCWLGYSLQSGHPHVSVPAVSCRDLSLGLLPTEVPPGKSCCRGPARGTGASTASSPQLLGTVTIRGVCCHLPALLRSERAGSLPAQPCTDRVGQGALAGLGLSSSLLGPLAQHTTGRKGRCQRSSSSIPSPQPSSSVRFCCPSSSYHTQPVLLPPNGQLSILPAAPLILFKCLPKLCPSVLLLNPSKHSHFHLLKPTTDSSPDDTGHHPHRGRSSEQTTALLPNRGSTNTVLSWRSYHVFS